MLIGKPLDPNNNELQANLAASKKHLDLFKKIYSETAFPPKDKYIEKHLSRGKLFVRDRINAVSYTHLTLPTICSV